MKRVKFFMMMFITVMISGIFTSCDEDNVDDFTSSVVTTPWMDNDGQIYTFYKYFSGVIYSSSSDYASQQINKSFIWSETDGKLTVAINGYRNEDGDMIMIDSDDLDPVTYTIKSYSNDKMVLTDNSSTITLHAYKN